MTAEANRLKHFQMLNVTKVIKPRKRKKKRKLPNLKSKQHRRVNQFSWQRELGDIWSETTPPQCGQIFTNEKCNIK